MEPTAIMRNMFDQRFHKNISRAFGVLCWYFYFTFVAADSTAECFSRLHRHSLQHQYSYKRVCVCVCCTQRSIHFVQMRSRAPTTAKQ